MMSVEIRQESACDIDAIRRVNIEAFLEHPFSRQTEHLIVDALRDAGSLDTSLVAVSEGAVVGHVALSRARVGDASSGWFLLGPLAVLPESQGRGIGSALVESTLEKLRSAGALGCVLVGDPGYYGRFGFSPFPDLTHQGVPDQYVLALPFTTVAPTGRIQAHEAFEIQPSGGSART